MKNFVSRFLLVIFIIFFSLNVNNVNASDVQVFTDWEKGYKLSIPVGSVQKSDFPNVFKRFETVDTVIEVYFDNLDAINTSLNDYIFYGNKFLYDSKRVIVTQSSWSNINGYRAHITSWKRNKLARVADDKNYYVAAVFARDDSSVTTIHIKSNKPIDEQKYLGGFEFLKKQYHASDTSKRLFKPSSTPMSEQTKETYQKLFGDKAELTWGIFEPTVGLHFENLKEGLEDKLKYKFKVAMIYQPLNSYAPQYLIEQSKKEGRIVELTLFTAAASGADALKNTTSSNSEVVFDILDGKYDEWLINYAKQLKEANYPVMLRLNNEMNGDWCWYNAVYTALDTEIYRKMWIYVHDIMRQQGVDNLIWVWNPHDKSFPNFAWNSAFAYYPGDEYVDVVGMTGYNTGNYFAGESWREFKEIYDPLYKDYSKSFDKPFILGEFASSSYGGNKSKWIKTMFEQIGNYPRIKVAVWWNGVDFDSKMNSARIYIITENEDTIKAFKDGLSKYNSDYKPQSSWVENFSNKK